MCSASAAEGDGASWGQNAETSEKCQGVDGNWTFDRAPCPLLLSWRAGMLANRLSVTQAKWFTHLFLPQLYFGNSRDYNAL